MMDREEHRRENGGVVENQTVVTINPERSDVVGDENRGLRNSNSNCGIQGDVVETVIIIDSDESERVSGESKFNQFGADKEGESAKPETMSSSVEKSLSLIDVKHREGKGEGESMEGETICRICHLSSGQSSDGATMAGAAAATDLIHLGCCCKGELGIAHSHCAEAWFKFKGNRICEICGETATSVAGVGDSRFMAEWNEGRLSDSSRLSSGGGTRFWRGQPLCNFLMACLVIAFVLPWFFRVHVF